MGLGLHSSELSRILGLSPSRGPISTPSAHIRDITCFNVIYGPQPIGGSLWRGRTWRVRQT